MPPIYLFVNIDVKTILIIALALAVAILSTCNSCNEKRYQKKLAQLENGTGKSSDTVVITKIDSVKTVIDNPVPYEVVKTQYKIHLLFDTLYIEGVDTVYIDTLVGRHYAINKYSDTTKVEHGYIVSNETVSQNKITSKSIQPFLSIPTTTITNTVTEKKRGQFFLSIDAYGNQKRGLTGAGFSGMWKSPNALAYEVGTYFDSTRLMNYKASIKFPITFKKK